jgi:hypothetical protein
MLNDPPQSYVESTLGELRALSEELWWEFSIQQAIVLIDDLTRVNRIPRPSSSRTPSIAGNNSGALGSD